MAPRVFTVLLLAAILASSHAASLRSTRRQDASLVRRKAQSKTTMVRPSSLSLLPKTQPLFSSFYSPPIVPPGLSVSGLGVPANTTMNTRHADSNTEIRAGKGGFPSQHDAPSSNKIIPPPTPPILASSFETGPFPVLHKHHPPFSTIRHHPCSSLSSPATQSPITPLSIPHRRPTPNQQFPSTPRLPSTPH